MPRIEKLDDYDFVVGRGEGVTPNGETVMLTAVRFVSKDGQHIVEVTLVDEARANLVAGLTGGIHPVRSFNNQGRS